MNKLNLAICIALLSGCGGGESETSSSVDNAPVEKKVSSLLADNKLTDDSNFNQYKDFKVTIDVTNYEFTSDTVFLKVYTDSNRTLYLGKANPQSQFSIHVPNNVDQIYFDLFSDFQQDKQINGVIKL